LTSRQYVSPSSVRIRSTPVRTRPSSLASIRHRSARSSGKSQLATYRWPRSPPGPSFGRGAPPGHCPPALRRTAAHAASSPHTTSGPFVDRAPHATGLRPPLQALSSSNLDALRPPSPPHRRARRQQLQVAAIHLARPNIRRSHRLDLVVVSIDGAKTVVGLRPVTMASVLSEASDEGARTSAHTKRGRWPPAAGRGGTSPRRTARTS
jgi:hypothetical protein